MSKGQVKDIELSFTGFGYFDKIAEEEQFLAAGLYLMLVRSIVNQNEVSFRCFHFFFAD